MQDISAVAAVIIAVGGAATVVGKFVVVPLLRVLRAAAEFFEDVKGRPARPGFEAEPGLFERLASIEHKVGRAEFHTGNGNPVSLRSVVESQGQMLEACSVNFEELAKTVALLAKTDTPAKPKRARTPRPTG